MSQLPPLPSWPSEVFENEPAHAFFRRIAKINGQVSARSLAEIFGINGRNIRPQDFVDFCSRFPANNIDHLAAYTPISDGTYAVIGGEVLSSKRDIGFKVSRVCPSCVSESQYYRNWFDIALVTRCPFHNQVLVAGVGESRLAWWHPEIAMTPDGVSVELLPPVEAIVPSLDWDLYVLGRVGAAERIEAEFLDEHPLSQVASAADVLGRSALVGWNNDQRDKFSKYHPSRGDALRAGFKLLKQGKPAIFRHLKTISAEGPYRLYGTRTGVERVFGNLRASVNRLSGELGKTAQSWLDEAAKDLGVVSRKGKSVGVHLKGIVYTLNEVADLLHLSPKGARSLVLKCGVSEKLQSRNSRHWITEEGLETLKQRLASLTPRRDACSFSGLTGREFDQGCEKLGILPFIRLGGTGRGSDQFIMEDVERVLRYSRAEAGR